MYHQDGRDITFHFGSAEDVTKATFSTGDNTGTFKVPAQLSPICVTPVRVFRTGVFSL